MASDDKEYEQSALGKRVNELMDDGYDFGEAVKQAMSEGLKDGGSVGIEILFGPKREDFNIGGRAKRNTPIDSRASVQDYAAAMQKVGAGTDAQKLQAIGEYGLNQMQNSPSYFKAVGQGINQHMINNQMLRDAVDAKRITEDQYKLMGGYDVAKLTPKIGLGNIKIGGTPGDVGIASALYNAIKAGGIGLEKLGIKEKDPFNQYGDIGFFESIAKNYQGAKGLSESDKALYESIISGKTTPKYPDYKTAALQSQYYKNNPSSLDPDLFKAAYARATDGPKTTIGSEGNIITNFGNWDPGRTYSAYMSNTQTSNSNPFFDQFKGSQYADMPAIMKAMYGDPGNLNPYYADGGRVGFKGGGHKSIDPNDLPPPYKKGFENVMDGPDAGIAARAFLARQQQKQSQPTKAIAAPTPKSNLENMNYIRQSMKQYGFSEPEILKAITQAGYADGGRVGLFMGGPALEGQALDIYTSMNKYGFSDQEIADALSARGLYGSGSGTATETTTPNIINQQIQSGGGGGGGITSLDPLTRQTTSLDPNSFFGKIANKIGGFTDSIYDKFSQSKLGSTFTQGGTKFKNLAITPMMALVQKRNPLNPNALNYNPNLQGQMDFLEGQTGTRVFGTSDNLKFEDAAMIGRDPNSGLAKYGPGSVLSGQNVVSGFGTNDYEKQLGKYLARMKTYTNPTKFQLEKIKQAEAELAKAEAAKQAAFENAMKQGQGFYDQFGKGDAASTASREQAGSGFSDVSESGPFKNGGLATMFTRRR